MDRLKKISVALALFILAAHLIQFSQLMTRESGHWGIVNSKDNDSAQAVSQMKKSTWKNADSGNDYGPLYIRLAHLALFLDPVIHTVSFKESVSMRETHYHLAMLMVSLMAFCGIGGLMGFWVGGNVLERLVAALILSWAFLMSHTWTIALFKAKPDILLTFLVGLATLLTVKSQQSNANINSIWFAAAVWGFAVATKLTAVLFLFPIVFLFFPPFHFKSLGKAALFYLTAFVSYLIIGLPQTLDFDRILSFYRGSYKTLVTKATFFEMKYYASEVISQLSMPFLLMVVLVFLFSKTSSQKFGSIKRACFLFLIPIVPLTFLLTKRWVSGMEHFYMPVVIATLVVFVPWLQLICQRLLKRWTDYFTELSFPVCSLTLLGFCFYSPIFSTISQPFEERTSCNEEADRIARKLSREAKRGHKIVADAYSAIESQAWDELGIKAGWGTRMEHLNGEAKVFATKKQFYERFLRAEPREADQKYYGDDWKEYSNFYFLVNENKPFKDRLGRTWELTDSSPCGWEIWISMD